MRFATEVETCGKRLSERNVGDRSAVGESAQRRLQRIRKTAGLNDHVRALLTGQFFDFQANIITDWVQTVIRAMTACDLTTMFDRIDTDDD